MKEIGCECRGCARRWLVFTEGYVVWECVFCGALVPWNRVR
jgi:ribosomal protein S27E